MDESLRTLNERLQPQFQVVTSLTNNIMSLDRAQAEDRLLEVKTLLKQIQKLSQHMAVVSQELLYLCRLPMVSYIVFNLHFLT